MQGDAVLPRRGAGGGEPRSGDEVYNTKCAVCHGTGAAGAPKFGDAGAWGGRVAKGLDTLTNAINGINGMPAKGLCKDCSEMTKPVLITWSKAVQAGWALLALKGGDSSSLLKQRRDVDCHGLSCIETNFTAVIKQIDIVIHDHR